MGSGLSAGLYAVVLAAGWASTQAPGAPPARTALRPWATVSALVLVGVPTLVQLTLEPRMLEWLARRPGELTDGQPWRLGTSLLVQDGGWPGTVFNLVELAVVGVVAERLWGPARWWAVWLAAGVGAQFWGMVVQPAGGGNSVATFGLAASVAVAALVRGAGMARWCAGVSLVAGLVLLAGRDIHGGAVALGALAGLVLLRSGAGARPAPTDDPVRTPGVRPPAPPAPPR